jgi:hypothetical protein
VNTLAKWGVDGIFSAWQPISEMSTQPNCGCRGYEAPVQTHINFNDKLPNMAIQQSEMPPLLAYEGSDGVFELVDGVTRATRVAKLLPGDMVRVEVLGKLRRPKANSRRIGDTI